MNTGCSLHLAALFPSEPSAGVRPRDHMSGLVLELHIMASSAAHLYLQLLHHPKSGQMGTQLSLRTEHQWFTATATCRKQCNGISIAHIIHMPLGIRGRHKSSLQRSTAVVFPVLLILSMSKFSYTSLVLSVLSQSQQCHLISIPDLLLCIHQPSRSYLSEVTFQGYLLVPAKMPAINVGRC